MTAESVASAPPAPSRTDESTGVDFEALVGGISSRFVNLEPSQVDRVLGECLGEIGVFLGVDRVVIYEPGGEDGTLTRTRAWAADGVEASPETVAKSSLPWIRRRRDAGQWTAVSRLDELPPEAEADRERLVERGVRSFFHLPLDMAGDQIGALWLATTAGERPWPAGTARRLTLLGDVFANALSRRTEAERAARRLGLERLVAGLSATFVNLPSEAIDRHLELALERLGRFLGVERCTLFQLEPNGNLGISHAWSLPEAEAPRTSFQRGAFPFLEQQGLQGKIVAFSDPSELPGRAEVDRRGFEALGIRSFASLPFAVGGAPLGILTLSSTRERVPWPEETLERLREVTDVLANAIARRRSDRELALRSRFDSLLADLSASFVNIAAEELDAQIQVGLERVSQFLGVDRSSIFRTDADTGTLRPSHSWRVDGAGPTPEVVSADGFRWIQALARRGETFAITSLDELPAEAEMERSYFSRLGVRSLASVPLTIGGEVGGALTFLTLDEPIHWAPEVLQRIRLVGEVFSAAISRGRQERRLARRIRFEDLLLELSAKLVELPAEEIAEQVERGLELVADHVNVDRVSFAEFSSSGHELAVSHCFARPPYPPNVGRRLHETFPPYAELLWRGETVRMDRLPPHDELASAEIVRLPLEGSEGVRSHLAVPVVAGGRTFGILSLSTFDHFHAWSDDQIDRLALVGGIFASALIRRRSDTDLKAAYDEIRGLNERLEAENVYLREELAPKAAEGMVGESAGLRGVLDQVARVAPTGTTVLVTGETGTGKELVAEAIHAASDRRGRAMIRVNCAALPSTLIESELFGREKGAYTGATARQAGRFEAADRSTLFLDEVAELPLETQAKLLRVLEEGRFERLGSTRTIEVDVRIVAATNRDLAEEVAQGRFREDLFYRLEVFPVRVPPLRERREDIPLLVWAFAREYAERLGKHVEVIPAANMQALQNYLWPGNVRELRNVVERAVILADGPRMEIRVPSGRAAAPAGPTLDAVQTQHIRSVLEQVEWRVRGPGGAAEILGLKPTTLEYRMKKLGVSRPQPPQSR
ncbi:MAG: sigma 54-interacting transcriptional regulator [Thermoanaerobaculia bacterium]|nr:sigma 54-interacting transcriptional regulator [Thermoanaerobaculia bacterium]